MAFKLACSLGRSLYSIHHRESGAIITYLAEKYDPEGKISAKGFEEKMKQLQWLFFQASGQGCVSARLGSKWRSDWTSL